MEAFSRSKSCGDNKMQMEVYSTTNNSNTHPGGMHDMRSYSTSYTSTVQAPTTIGGVKEGKLKKSKTGGVGVGSSSSKGWSLSDPELQRKKRVASYKVYAVEGQMKGSFRKSFRWLKERYTQVVYGWR